MFTDDELRLFDDQFKLVGITEEDEQRRILEFFYAIGKIIYQIHTGDYEEEN
jgi:hypothetical protein